MPVVGSKTSRKVRKHARNEARRQQGLERKAKLEALEAERERVAQVIAGEGPFGARHLEALTRVGVTTGT